MASNSRVLILNGKVKLDERRIRFSNHYHFGGRIEKLLKNYEGEKIRKGSSGFNLTLLNWVAAQVEFLETKEWPIQTQPYEAAKRKLRVLENQRMKQIAVIRAKKESRCPKSNYLQKSMVNGYSVTCQYWRSFDGRWNTDGNSRSLLYLGSF